MYGASGLHRPVGAYCPSPWVVRSDIHILKIDKILEVSQGEGIASMKLQNPLWYRAWSTYSFQMEIGHRKWTPVEGRAPNAQFSNTHPILAGVLEQRMHLSFHPLPLNTSAAYIRTRPQGLWGNYDAVHMVGVGSQGKAISSPD